MAALQLAASFSHHFLSAFGRFLILSCLLEQGDLILEDDIDELLLLVLELNQQFLDVGLMRSDWLELVTNIIACLRLIVHGVPFALARGLVEIMEVVAAAPTD